MTNSLKWWRDHKAQVLEVLAPWGVCRHLKVWRTDRNDGIAWDVLQAIKNEMVGPDVWMIEVYPPESQVMNDLNMRHLWEVPAHHVYNMRNPNANARCDVYIQTG